MTTYTKLRDGSWGVRVQGSAKAGDRVTVTKKSGGSKVETIAKVLWSGNGISLCSIGGSSASSSSKHSRRTCQCGGSGPIVADDEGDCYHCGFPVRG